MSLNPDRPVKDSNPWEWAEPMTAEELVELRKKLVPAGEVRTCDECSFAPSCTLAFDDYNTDGDCLYEK